LQRQGGQQAGPRLDDELEGEARKKAAGSRVQLGGRPLVVKLAMTSADGNRILKADKAQDSERRKRML
jgi:hypothetical protein